LIDWSIDPLDSNSPVPPARVRAIFIFHLLPGFDFVRSGPKPLHSSHLILSWMCFI
jgi:hypothetical protein